MSEDEILTLRDVFAAFALAGHLACPEAEATSDFAAEAAYRYADAMLKHRKAED